MKDLIMKDEIQVEIRMIILGKATGLDRIAVKFLEALEEYGIDKIATLLNEIYDTDDSIRHLQICISSTAKETRERSVNYAQRQVL